MAYLITFNVWSLVKITYYLADLAYARVFFQVNWRKNCRTFICSFYSKLLIKYLISFVPI